MFKPLFTVSAALMLAACASPMPQQKARMARPAPVTLMTPCPAPVAPEDASLGSLLSAYVETASRLHACMDQCHALTVWLRSETDGRLDR